MLDTNDPRVAALAAALPCEDPEEPCDADGRDEHRWCDNCIARNAIAALDGWTLVRDAGNPWAEREHMEATIARLSAALQSIADFSDEPEARMARAALAAKEDK